jgi:hypothetical protein
MTIFDTSTYPRPADAAHCLECRALLTPYVMAVHRPYLRRFKKLTGRKWPGDISLNLLQDFRTLHLDTNHIPDRASFCLKCAVEYMEEFNRRNAERLAKVII